MKRNRTIANLLIFILIVTAACQAIGQKVKREQPMAPLPPQVIQVMPSRGEEQPLDAPIQILFDQAMDQQSVEASLSIEPTVRGSIEWATERLLQFKPGGRGFERGTRYTVTLGEDIRSTADLPIRAPYQFNFSTVGYLEVSSVLPQDGTQEVALDARVTVIFNRPVVALRAIEDEPFTGTADNLPQPLTFVPPLRGVGEWLNTSIYTFTPDDGFDPATIYRARIAAGLTDTTGGVLEDDVTWEFTTIKPAVAATYPDADTIYVSTEPQILVAFNQPMDHTSAEAAFELRTLATNQTVSGSFEWHEDGLIVPEQDTYQPYQWSWSRGAGPERIGVETMVFTPDEALDFGSAYRAILGSGANSANDKAATETPYRWVFDTIEFPRIDTTSPGNEQERVDPHNGIEISFSSSMNPDSIGGNFTISPPISPTDVYTYWWDNNTQLEISFPVEPNSAYTVTLSGDIEGRYGQKLGTDTVIHWSTRGYDPIVHLNAPYRVGTHSAYTETLAYVTVRNLGRVDFALYQMPLGDFLRTNGSDSWEYWDEYTPSQSNLIREWTLETDPPVNQRRAYSTQVASEPDTPLPPGIYYLQIAGDATSVYPEAAPAIMPDIARQILVVSRHNVTLKTTPDEVLAWVTDLNSGQGEARLPLLLIDDQSNTLARGSTDSDGLFFSESAGTPDRWTPIFAFVGNPDEPSDDFAVGVSQWDNDISPWRFDLSVAGEPDVYNTYVFTEKPIYRPGQTVYFKGVVRKDDDARYSLPRSNTEVSITIYDGQNNKVYEGNLPVSELGTWDGELTLDENAALGIYGIDVEYQEEYFWGSFQVAEYRVPEFQVEISAAHPEYAQGETINVMAEASYFFGGPVANAEVRTVVLSTDHYFDYQGPGWWDFVDYDTSRWGGGSAYGEQIAEDTSFTDGAGRFTFSIDADITEYTASQRFTLEATVTDVNNQEVSNRTEVIVHKGKYYIGLRPERYVGRVGREDQINLITVDWESKPVPRQEVTVVFVEHTWYSVKKLAEDGLYYWESSVEDTPVFTSTVETDSAGLAAVAFTPEKGGTYKITARGTDEAGNEILSTTFMWVSGHEYVTWQQENNDRIELIADKREYQVGDTATILIPHPYQGPVKALITVERGHIYEHWVQTLETNSEQLSIPITEAMIPNVYVSVVIVKGSDETSPVPSFKIGYVQLPIQTTEKELSISLTPDKSTDEHYEPGETVSYDVLVTDSQGNPVEAELAVSLVDLAVLTLADQREPAITDYFWRQRGLMVQTASGLTQSGDRVNETLASDAKGLGGGGGAEEFGPVRRRFPDTAYWNPALHTDANGKAQISVSLPDNLTTWRLRARGITTETQVGEALVDIVSSKDLLVRPMTPRFFVTGDEAELAAVVHNNTSHPLEVEIALQATGLHVGDSASQCVRIPANDNAKVVWPVIVGSTELASLRFSARNIQDHACAEGQTVRAGAENTEVPVVQEELSDAVQISLPIYRYSTPEVVATAGYLDEDGDRLEAVVLPPSYDSTQGELTIQIDPSLAAGMVAGLDYLTHFPYACTEQTVSRFLPNVMTHRALQDLGLSGSSELVQELQERLPTLVSVGVQRLYSQQQLDGGWGWWSTDESDPFLSAYALLGLLEAQRADFPVEETIIAHASEFLHSTLGKPASTTADAEQQRSTNEQAFVLYVLAEANQAGAGDKPLSEAITLFQRRDTLDTFGKAYLALALDLMEPETENRVKTLLSDISNAAIVSATGAHWEEAQPDYFAMNTDTRSTAIVLATLARLDPENALALNAVRWLMATRRDGFWETTQETAWAIIGLTDWMVATGELEGAYDWTVAVNSAALGSGSVSEANIDTSTQLQIAVADLLGDAANRVLVTHEAPEGATAGSGRLYYGLSLRYFKPAEEVTALSRGIIVSRRYTLSDCDPETDECTAIDSVQVGDTIRVQLTIIAPYDLHYVVVEDPFPAGTEGVDTSLLTTSVAEEAPELMRTDRADPWTGGYGWWWFSQTELRDEKAVLFASYLPKGTYEYSYLIRASLPGEYRAIPTHAYEMYFPEVFGRSDGGVFTVGE